MIWQEEHLTTPSRKFSLFVIIKKDIIISLTRTTSTDLMMFAKTMGENYGAVGPCQTTWDWVSWVATDRTALLSRTIRGLSFVSSGGKGARIRLLESPDYLGVVEQQGSGKYSVLCVDMIGKDLGNIISLRFSSKNHSPEQLWEMAEPILEGMKPDITLGKIQHILAVVKEGKSSPPKTKRHSFGELLREMDSWNVKGNEEWMKEAKTAFKEGWFEDCKWALVQPILDNYEGGKPYVLFGRALMKQGYPGPADFFYRKAEFWMKDDPELKALEAEAEHELDKRDPTGKRFKPNPEAEEIIREAKELLEKTAKK